MSVTAAHFDAFALLAELGGAEGVSPPHGVLPAAAGFSGFSNRQGEPCVPVSVPVSGLRELSGISNRTVAHPAVELPDPPPGWRSLPFGPERGAAFALARRQPGACRICAGRLWWRHPDGAPCCAVCHPAPSSCVRP